mmetsp:Transcript_9251/g.16763  ORF Transcript_9251/g.16763 Transcript_9251/m.16763 type:complete len:319 (+) Transcript_9251:145-1101(+)
MPNALLTFASRCPPFQTLMMKVKKPQLLANTVKKWRDEKDNDAAFPAQFETLYTYSQAEEWCTKLGVEVEMGRERVRPQRLEGAASTAGMQQSASARAANAGESVKAKVYRTMWIPIIDSIESAVQARFSEESLSLGKGVHAFLTFSNDDSPATFCEKFLQKYNALSCIARDIEIEWHLVKNLIVEEDRRIAKANEEAAAAAASASVSKGKGKKSERMEPLEGRAYNVLKYMNDSSVGEGNVSSTPRKEQYPKFYKALVFAATIAFTSASSERSFSKLKWVKTRLRSTMTDERLSSLMIMTCELDLMEFHSHTSTRCR